jgi:hypothetical protein
MNPDFSDRTYTAEVMKVALDPDEALKTICRLTTGPRNELKFEETDGRIVRIIHTFAASERPFHRIPRRVVGPDGQESEIPRTAKIRGVKSFLYDVFIAQSQKHIVVAAPFHDFAEFLFPKIDRTLAGTRTLYQKLDITELVIQLDAGGPKHVKTESEQIRLSVTRCHLAYADSDSRTGNLQQVQMTGSNLGASPEYGILIAPVLKRNRTTDGEKKNDGVKSSLIVTPVVLGFALSVNGVRKSSASTDRHGNFKLWIAPGLRRLTRIFALLAAIEDLRNVASTTSDIPILQSNAIKKAED